MINVSLIDGVVGSPLENDLDALMFRDVRRYTQSGTGLPSGWGFSSQGGFTLVQETLDSQDGLKSAKILATVAPYGYGELSKSGVTVAGRMYRVSGSYCCAGDSTQLEARVLIGNGVDTGEILVADDGRSSAVNSALYFPLKWTGEIWRRFTVTFVAPASTVSVRLRLVAIGSGGSGSVLFDRVTLKRVWREDTYEPRLPSDGVSPLATSSPGIFFSGKSVGSGNVDVMISDGQLDLSLGQLTWLGQTVKHFVGGVVPGVGRVDRDEWDQRFTGIVQDLDSDDEIATFALEDIRTRFHKPLPPNSLSTADLSIAENDRGRAKAILFGGKTSIRPQGIGYDPLARFRKYLVADCTDAPNGIQSIDAIYAYENEDAATKLDAARRLKIALPTLEIAPTLMKYGIAAVANPTSFQVSIQKGAGSGFTDNVASSHEVLWGDGYVEWQAGGVTSSSVIVGLADVFDQRPIEQDIDYGFHLNAGTMRVLENNVQKIATTSYTGVTKFRVERVGNQIFYKYDLNVGGGWITYYTSLTTFTGPLAVKIGISTANAWAFAVSVFGFGQVSLDLANGQFTIREHVGPIHITLDNQFLNFDVDGSTERTAKIPVGLYTAIGVAKAATESLKAQTGSSELSTEYDQTTGKYSIKRASGTPLNLRISNGTNKDASAWGTVLGWDRSANDTGATTYTADNAVWDVLQVDSKHIIRCDARGYKDDSLGSWTGTPLALIERGSDIIGVIVVKFLKYPLSTLDSGTFIKARTTAATSLAIYHKEQLSSQVIFERVESSDLANIIIGGDGKIYFLVYDYNDETVPLSRRLEERDHIVRPRWKKKTEEVFRAITILYDQRADNDIWRQANAEDPSVANKFQRIESKQVETYVRHSSSADVLAQRTLVLAQRPPTRATVVTNAKLFRRRIGDIVSITRRRSLTAQVSIINRPFRIVSISPDPMAGTVNADVVEAVTLPAGYNCLSNCQELCQLEKQNECAFQAQEGCAISCQVPCQVAAQGCGFTICQTSCENTCQSCGQAGFCQTGCQTGACQTGCQIVCQGGCEGGSCQTCGQGGNCQTGCQVSCQSCGQGPSCQTCGQTSGCQQACQVNCQDCGQAGHCQTGCQTTCQSCGESAGPCQTSCQTGGCQNICQFSCQDVCQVGFQGPDQQG